VTHTIACAACRDSLIDFVAERLPLEERAAVEQHLAGCTDCRRELAGWHALKASFADVAQDVPPDTGSAAGWRRLHDALGTQPSAGTLTLEPPAAPTTVELDGAPSTTAPAVRAPLPLRLRGTRFAALQAVAAVLVVSVLAAAVFHALGGGRTGTQGQHLATVTAAPQATITAAPPATPSPAPSACPPGSGVRANLPNASYLGDLSMVSATEGWASGSIVDPTMGYNQGSLLLHFSHCTWSQGAPSIPDVALGSIDMLSASEGWAVGGTQSGPEHGVALHYSNGVWRQVTLPGQSTSEGTYTVVKMLSASEGWIIFQYVKSTTGGFSYYALHYHNSVWTRVNLSYTQIGDIAPVGPDELWLAATTSNGDAAIVHYQAGTQTLFPLPGGYQAGTFHVISANDVWLPGWRPANYDYTETTYVFVTHWDGTSWTASSVGRDPGIQNVKGLTVFSETDGWAFPAPLSTTVEFTPITSTMRLGASGWVAGSWVFTDISGVEVVREVGPDEYWAIGSYMQTYTYPNGSQSSNEHTVLLHYAGGRWSMYGHG
jgi:hypothetical protein